MKACLYSPSFIQPVNQWAIISHNVNKVSVSMYFLLLDLKVDVGLKEMGDICRFPLNPDTTDKLYGTLYTHSLF